MPPNLILSNIESTLTDVGFDEERWDVTADITNAGDTDAKGWWSVAFLDEREIERDGIFVAGPDTRLPPTSTSVLRRDNPLDDHHFIGYPATVEFAVGYIESGSDAALDQVLSHPDSHATDSISIVLRDPDVSQAEIVEASLSATSPSPNVVDVQYDLRNVVLSGGGNDLSVTIDFEVDGNVVGNDTVNINADQTRTLTATLSGVQSGSRQICVAISNVSEV